MKHSGDPENAGSCLGSLPCPCLPGWAQACPGCSPRQQQPRCCSSMLHRRPRLCSFSCPESSTQTCRPGILASATGPSSPESCAPTDGAPHTSGRSDLVAHPHLRGGQKLQRGSSGEAGPTSAHSRERQLESWRPVWEQPWVPGEQVGMERGVWTLTLVLGVAAFFLCFA